MYSGPLANTLRTIESEIQAVREHQNQIRFLMHQVDHIPWGDDSMVEHPILTRPPPRHVERSDTSHNPITKAIVDKIIAKYGSMEEYYRVRKQKQGLVHVQKMNSRESNELKECTFRPAITKFNQSTVGTKIDGLDSFLKRQEKAREIQCLQKIPKPGSGKVYTGQVTRPVPFSFAKKLPPQSWEVRE
jgi:hypothetical protein